LTCTSTGINQTMVEESSTSATYNLYGLKVNDNYKGIIIKNGKMIMSKSSR